LSEKDVQRLIDVEDLIRALERAHIQFSAGKAVMPVRMVVPVPEIKGRITSMPAYLSEDKALGMKVVTYFPENPGRGLPIILATIFVYSTASGKLFVTVTTAKEPIVKAEWLKPGVHINAIGSHRPDLREIDGATMRRAKLVVDSREAVMAECGDILLAIKEGAIEEDHIHAEIGEVLAGKKAGRTSASEITLYKAVGIAIQDVATAKLVYERAVEKKIGVEVEV